MARLAEGWLYQIAPRVCPRRRRQRRRASAGIYTEALGKSLRSAGLSRRHVGGRSVAPRVLSYTSMRAPTCWRSHMMTAYCGGGRQTTICARPLPDGGAWPGKPSHLVLSLLLRAGSTRRMLVIFSERLLGRRGFYASTSRSRMSANVREPPLANGHMAEIPREYFPSVRASDVYYYRGGYESGRLSAAGKSTSPKPRFPIDGAIFADPGSVFCAELP